MTTVANKLNSQEVRAFFSSRDRKVAAYYALWNFDSAANHDKVYFAMILKTSNGYALIAKWGRRGSSLSEQLKATGSYELCTAQMNELVNAKLGKGYVPVNPTAVTIRESAQMAGLPVSTLIACAA